jgi:molybdate transport system substrate-binding protein
VAGTGTRAAELKVMASGAMAHALNEIAANFAKKNGDTLAFTQGTTGTLQDKIRAGETPDVVEVTSGGMDDLVKEKLVVPGTRVELARAILGLAVPDGAATPDIANADSLKRTLLAAKKVAYIDPKLGGQAGDAILGVLRNLGIEQAVQKKAVYGKTGADAVGKLVHGDADVAISFISEILPITGAKSVGAIPDALQKPTQFSAAVGAKSANPEKARALLAAMQSPDAHAVMEKAGLRPGK